MKRRLGLAVALVIMGSVVAWAALTLGGVGAWSPLQFGEAKTERPLSDEASELGRDRAEPHDKTLPGYTPVHMYGEPAWAKTVRAIPRDEIVDTVPPLRHADSVWRDGSVPEKDYTLWDPLFVFTDLEEGGVPVVGTYVMDAQLQSTKDVYEGIYPAPRAIGPIEITAIDGEVVRFATADGRSGSFNLKTHEWTLPK